MLDRSIVHEVEHFIYELVHYFLSNGVAILKVRKNISGKQLSTIKPNDFAKRFRYIYYSKAGSRHHFSLIIYVLAEVHYMQIGGVHCNSRSLFYKDRNTIICQNYINAAKKDVSKIFCVPYWHLGIVASVKGLIAGDLLIYLSNGDIIDCNVNKGAISLPQDFGSVERLITQATFILVVEKETIFESLMARNIFSSFESKFILITGKGYPDFITRRIVYYLNCQKDVPAYIIVDADPFGIDIMLVYRHGSKADGFKHDNISCPQIRWIGFHPSEIPLLKTGSIPLDNFDRKKTYELLQRGCISNGVVQELYLLQKLQLKAEIESVLNLLVDDYIPNKIKRNLFL